ncbi:MAG: hypothetical protein ACI8TQ_003333 [Planctomycetota bacterium]|jgi:hypothetical protein
MSPTEKINHRRSLPEMCLASGICPDPLTPAQVARKFRELIDSGSRLVPAGMAREDPELLLTRRYLPRFEIRLFDVTYYLTGLRFNQSLGYFVGYVRLGGRDAKKIYPRIFYKDSSLVWRVASHFVHDDHDYWIGKGDVRFENHGGEEYLTTIEETTNLPFELQAAFDEVSRRKRRVRDHDAVELVLRAGTSNRIRPYADFVTPRKRASEQYQVNGGRKVARFKRRGDPSSLNFVQGFEPDFAHGVQEVAHSISSFFGGELRKFRILSTNRLIQYQFCATPRCVWINPPQTMTTELSSYGVRVHDVFADDRLFIPAFEYHDSEDTDNILGQIPAGYAGEPHPKAPDRADASAWIEALPVVKQFRAKLL